MIEGPTSFALRIVSEFIPSQERPISEDSDLEKMGMDSLAKLDFLWRIEREYDIHFECKDLGSLKTIRSISDYVKKASLEKYANQK